jgi:hypothetical protein
VRCQFVGIAILAVASPGFSAEPPLVEKYLHSGELARGEQEMEAALAAAPRDDQARFGLGVLRFARGVERLGQSLHEYGSKADNQHLPFLRLPVPNNPDPAPISYHAFRRILDDFIRDLSAAEATLAAITDENVKLPLRLAAVRLDFTGAGRANENLIDIMKKLMRQQFDFLKDNADFRVHFDRGDVAWFRAYCHLLCAMADFYLAFDTEGLFNQYGKDHFARLRKPPGEAGAHPNERSIFAIKEPARLHRFRKHVLKVCELNRETWKFIRAEKDNDFEWLPNARQKGAIGLPVRDEMVDAWLGMIDEVEALFSGRKLVPAVWVSIIGPKSEDGLNLQKLLDDPPAKIDLDWLTKNGVPAKYLQKGPEVNAQAIFRAATVFGDSLSVAYAAWFN